MSEMERSDEQETAAEMLDRVECMAAGELGDTSDRDRAALKFVLESHAALRLAAIEYDESIRGVRSNPGDQRRGLEKLRAAIRYSEGLL